MPSVVHEALIELFRERPRLVFELISASRGLDGQQSVIGEVLDSALSEVAPAEYRADLVVRLRGSTELLVVVEVQLKPDGDKRLSWPVYTAIAAARHRVQATVLVITLDRATARWDEDIVFC